MNANEIIRNIEAAELKAELPEFQVGDTVKVYGRIVEGNRTRTLLYMHHRLAEPASPYQLHRHKDNRPPFYVCLKYNLEYL